MPHDKAGGPAHRIKKITASEVGLLGVLATALGILATLLVGIFQFISGYNDRVTNLAKADLDKATSTLTNTVSALSGPLALQERLIWAYYQAHPDTSQVLQSAGNESPVSSKAQRGTADVPLASAQAMVKDYKDAFTKLSAAAPLLARQIEIDLDLPSELNHTARQRDPDQTITTAGAKRQPTNSATLHKLPFGCDKDLPTFGKDISEPRPRQLPDKDYLVIDWRNAKDNLVTLEYCFEDTHYNKMNKILSWVSGDGKDVDQSQKSNAESMDLKELSILQSRRFNDFMSVATFKIEGFRAKYQPNGIICSLVNSCTPPKLFSD
jgi:hypothetical protein